MKQTVFQNWVIESSNFNFSVLTNKDELCIKSIDSNKSELFYGQLTENSVLIYSLDYYQIQLTIDADNKRIKLHRIEYED